MKEIELSAGTIEYQDTGGDGPTIVLLHGLMMDAPVRCRTTIRPHASMTPRKSHRP